MKIMTAEWTSIVNMLVVVCDCGKRFKHRTDRWVVTCPDCGLSTNLSRLRDEWALSRPPAPDEVARTEDLDRGR